MQHKLLPLQRWVRSRARQGMAVLLTLLILTPAPAWAQTIRDVPPDHWAYAAVQRLVAEGYLTLADNQMFRGDQPVDRYTFAAVLARVLDQVQGTDKAIPKEIQDLLTRLATEFREELVAWQAAREDLERRTAAIDAEVQALTAPGGPVDAILARVAKLEASATQRGEDIAKLAEEASRLAQEITRLRDDLGLQTGTLDQRLAEFQNQIEGDLGVQGINLGQSLADLASRLQQTSDALAQQARRLEELEQAVAELRTTLEERLAAQLAEEKRERLAADEKLLADLEALEARLEQQRQEMAGADGQLLAEIRDVANRLDVLQSTPGTVAGVQTRQLQLERQLASLQRDFEAYRTQAEEANRSLRTTSIVGVAAALVAIVAALVSK
ncbi:MAG TPA: S-layer homology domain-containing protein [Limnochorda sp.]